MEITKDPNDKVVEITAVKDQFLSAWYAIKRNIQEEIPTPADVGFLMEVMGDLAKAVNDEDMFQSVKMPLRKWVGTWHCLNICLNNKLFSSIEQEMMMSGALEVFAEKIDEANRAPEEKDAIVKSVMDTPPDTVIKQGLRLVDGGKD